MAGPGSSWRAWTRGWKLPNLLQPQQLPLSEVDETHQLEIVRVNDMLKNMCEQHLSSRCVLG